MGGYFGSSYGTQDHVTTAFWNNIQGMDQQTIIGACLMALAAMAVASTVAQVNYRFFLSTPTGLACVAALGAGAYYAYTQTSAPYVVQDYVNIAKDSPFIYGGAVAFGLGAVVLLKQLGFHAHIHLKIL